MSFALSVRARRFLMVSAAALLSVPTTVVLSPVSSPAAATPPQTCSTLGGFEIDGDMLSGTSNCTGGGTDWNNVNAQVNDTVGTYNTGFKDTSDPINWTGSGGTPSKVGLTVAFARTAVVNGHFDAFVGWVRPNTTGTGSYVIEIDNAGTRIGNGVPQPDRSNGGYVVYISFNGNNLPTFDKACAFTSVADYPGTCTSTPGNNYYGAINESAISAADNPINNADVPIGGFFETAFDLTALTNITPSCPSPPAASMYLRSITGGTDKNIKGWVGPVSVQPDSTCVAPDISTIATPGNSTIDGLQVTTAGSAQHDEVTVGGSGGPAIGSVKFYLCQPGDVTANQGCVSGGDLISTEPLDASGQASSGAVSGSTTPNDNTPGTYCWRAEFTPDATDHHYFPGTHTNYGSECFTVAHASPSIATQITATTDPGAAPGSLGLTTVSDTATLSNVVSGADLSGQDVTFSLYYSASAPDSTSCGGAPVTTLTGPLTKVDSTTWQATTTLPTATVKPTAAGYYTWVASYGGDLINDPASDGCGQAKETTQIVGPELSVEKDTTTPTISAGDTAAFDIKLRNLGGGTATNISVTDPLPILPSGHTWALTSNYGCTIGTDPGRAGGQLVTCTIATFNPTTDWVTIASVSATTGPADCGTISNTAYLTADNTPPGQDGASVTVNCPALTILKTAAHGTVNAGDSISYTVTVSNTGKGNAYDVVVTDTVPVNAGLSWTAVSSGAQQCTLAAGTYSCPFGTLAPGGSGTVTFTSPTTPATCGTVSNQAGASLSNGTPVTSAIVPVTVNCPNVTLTKSADAPAVNAGTPIGYTITLANAGPGEAYGVSLHDTLPTGTGITWTIDAAHSSGPLNCSISSGTLSCATGTLPAGASQIVHITSPTSYDSCKEYDNTATATVTNQTNGSLSAGPVPTTVLCADLVITKTPDHTVPVNVGSNIGFTITITNNGTGDATGVHVSDTLPSGPGISWIVDSQTGTLNCTPTSAVTTLGCTGNLAKGASEVVHIYSATSWTDTNGVVVNSCDNGNNGEYDNTATLRWDNGPNRTISSATVHETVQCPNLSITKTADAPSVSVGSTIGFTVEVTNAGPGTATGATINDPLPSGPGVNWGIESVSGTAAGNCSINAGTGVLTCNLGDLAAKADVKVHITSTTSWTTTINGDVNSCDGGQQNNGVYDNTATLHVSNAPSLDDSASTTVTCPDVVVSKSADAATVSVGTAIGFTVTVANNGSGTATNVRINDPLPVGEGVLWTVDAIDGVSGPFNNPPCTVTVGTNTQTLNCSFGDMAPATSHTVHISSTTVWTAQNNSCGNYPNTAAALVGNEPGMPQSNTATVVVQCPALSVVKTADAPSVNVGSPIGFTIEVTNAGPGIATGVTLNDPLPAGPGISWTKASVSGTDPTNCAITGNVGSQVLSCTLGALTTTDDVKIHVTSPTSWTDTGTVVNSCTGGRSGTYDNTATLTAGNEPSIDDTASTTVQCPSLTFTKTADAGTVDVGSAIGFVIRVTNAGPGAATGVQINDPLPGGPGVSWGIDAANTTATGCLLSGTAPTQTLSCTLTSALGAGTSVKVHITSGTSWTDTAGTVVNSCTGGNGSGLYDNTATLTLTNAPAPAPAEDSTLVQCPSLTLTKTADNTSVSVGSQIGFTIEATNNGPGTAKAVTLDDPLPVGPGINWQPDPGTFPATCQIIGTGPAAQDLSCNLGDMAPGADVRIHVVSDTSWTGTGQSAVNSCDNGHSGVYDNTATLTPANAPEVTASARTAVQCPNLTVVKTADTTVVNAGDTIGYTITVTNTGAGAATAVTITDTVPADAGLNWSVDQTSNGVTCGPISNGVLTCTAGTLAANGGSAWVHLTSPTTADTCGTVTNTASTASSNGATDVSQPADITVNCPDVTLTKTADARAVNAGTPIGYTVTLANAGPGDAYGVTLNDPLPTGTGISWSLDSSDGPLSCSISAGTLSCAAGTLPAGSSQVIHVVSQTSFASCADYRNTATAGVTNQVDGSLSAGPIPTSVLCAAVVITKTADHTAPVSVGTPIGFTVTVTNNGEGDAKGVTVTDPLPTGPGLTWTVADQTGPMSCSVSGNDLSCTGDLKASATQTVHVTSPTVWQDTPDGVVNSCLGNEGTGVYNNTATVSWTNGPALPISSNQATETVQCPAVTITKTADADTVSVGQDIGFTVAVTNAGPGDATDVTVNDPLPGGPGVDWSIDPANTTTEGCSITGTAPTQTLTCALGTLGASEGATVHVVSHTSWTTGEAGDVNSCAGGPNEDGTYDNTAQLTLGNAPGSSASASTTVQCPAVTIIKTADAASVDVGSPIGYTVAVSNAGPGDATNVTVDDPLPTGTANSGVLWTADGNEACAITVTDGSQTLACTFATLAAGESQSVHVSSPTGRTFDSAGTVLTDACGTYDNTATLTVDNQPGSPTASASTAVLCPTLTLTKVGDAPASTGLGQPGQDVGYTLTGTNTGDGTAINAVLTDPLPGTPLAGATTPGHLNWSIDSASTGSNCSITGDIGSQVLVCTPGDLAPGASVTVHVTSPTNDSTCGTIDNTGSFTADSTDTVTASAELGVICAAIITPTPSHSPEGTTVPPLSYTGAGPIGTEIGWALGLFGLGLVLLLVGSRRRRRRAH